MVVTIVTFLLLGCLLEGLPAIVLLAPLMFPIAKDLGITASTTRWLWWSP
jgi:TRAP-type C4-dicarboxylate transport system permease large subunit